MFCRFGSEAMRLNLLFVSSKSLCYVLIRTFLAFAWGLRQIISLSLLKGKILSFENERKHDSQIAG